MLDQGEDELVYGRYLDIENLGQEIKFGMSREFKSSSTYKTRELSTQEKEPIPTEEEIMQFHKDTAAKQMDEKL